MKALLRPLWMIESHIRGWIALSRWIHRFIPVLGRALSLLLDRVLLTIYGIDVISSSVDVGCLSVAHPGGVLLGGNGVRSPGRVAVMAGVKFVGRSPADPDYLEAAERGATFELGDNVVIGVNSVLVGPISICDNVIIGTLSLVNRSITEPGTYVGIPARKVSDHCGEEWVGHLRVPGARTGHDRGTVPERAT